MLISYFGDDIKKMAVIKHLAEEMKVNDGSAIKEACEELGVPFFCKEGVCGTCFIEILNGKENLEQLNEKEKNLFCDSNHRLACQAKIKKGDVKIMF